MMRVRHTLSRLPIAAQVIVALLVLGLGSHIVVFSLSVIDGRKAARAEAAYDLRNQLHFVQGALEQLSYDNYKDRMGPFLNSLSVLSSQDIGLLIDVDGRIIASSRPHAGDRSNRYPWLPPFPRSAPRTADLIEAADGSLIGMVPVCHLIPGSLAERHCDWLVIRHGVAWRHARVWAAEYKASLALLSANILFSLLCWWMINEAVARPGQAMVQAIRRFRDGDRDARCQISGGDEIAVIGQAVDETFDTINAQASRLKLLDQAIAQSRNAVIITDPGGNIVFVNPAFESMSGYRAARIVGRNIAILQSDAFTADDADQMWQTLHRGETWAGEFCNRRQDGHHYWVRASISPLRDASGEITHFLSIQEDLTERRAIEARLAHRETYDELTGLPNRRFALNFLQNAIEAGGTIGVVHLDIDALRKINDSLGPSAGDAVIAETARRLQKHYPPPHCVAHMAGDEFLIVIVELDSPVEAETHAVRLLNAASEPVSLPSGPVTLGCRAGVAVCPRDGTDAVSLARDAYSAANRAKDAGGGVFMLFNPALDEQVRQRFELSEALKHAVARDELELHVQPYVAASSGVIQGAEALVRWRRNGTLVSPADFIPLAEMNGAIVGISHWILETAAAASHRWAEQEGCPVPVAVNISPVEFHDTDLLTRLKAVKQKWPKASLEIEVTEGIFAGNADAGTCLHAIAALGFPLAIDDFGTGYSSLGYLRDFPFSKLKVDRSFIVDCVTESRHRDIVAATVGLAHQLGLVVTAEGVETRAQADYLAGIGVEYIQGYFFHRPVPLAAFRFRS